MFIKGEDELYAIPTRFSFYGISFNTDFLSPEEATSWEVLFREDLQGKVGLFDWYLPNMGNASLANFPNSPTPYALESDQLTQVKDWLIRLKPQLGLIAPQTQDIAVAMSRENIIAAPVGDLDLDLIVEGYTNFASTVPDEGSIRWSEGAALCADSQNQELALAWIKYMSRPDVQARLAYTKALKARSPNLKTAAYWSEEERQLLGYVPDPDRAGKLMVERLIEKSVPRDLPVNQPEKAWQDLYNEFKTS